ncbi:MAG: FAD-dependent oxidoreductase [Desulfobacteraceae bacterium]|nr:FAD-dependent oxidoreductase [Desulfobacteraceae bacterium]
METYDIIIIGSGPAGLTAGLYTNRSKLRTLIIEKEALGGELANRDLIENYPSYPDGILGPELSSRMVNQAVNYGTEIQLGEVEQVQIDGNRKVVKTSFGEFAGKAIIIAGGTHNKKLGVPGEEEFVDKGVFYCATCDGPRFADKVVAIVGGGDSGITEGLFLARLVSKVIIIEMLPQCTATKILQDRAFSNPKIEIKCGSKIEAITGDEWVKALDLLDIQTGKKSTLEVDGVLVHVGVEPNTDYLSGIVPLDSKGHILVNEKMETEIPGVFAAGDIRHNSPMQIATAVGDGATAALSASRFLMART